MIQASARRFALALAFCVVAATGTGFANAQSTPKSITAADSVTGTDPVPKGVAAPPTTNSTQSPTAAMTQALLVFLGLA